MAIELGTVSAANAGNIGEFRMKRLVTTGLLAVAALFGGFTVASAQAPQAIERSGNTFHAAVCPHGGPPGIARCHARVVTDSNGRPIVFPKGKPNFGFAGYYATDLRAAYGINWTGAISDVPAGTLVAVVDANGYAAAEAHLGTYRHDMGLPPCTTSNNCFKKVNQDGVEGSYPGDDTGWAQETALDLDMVSAICPQCRILLVEANSASFDDLGKAVDRAVLMGAKVVSNSYGNLEVYGPSYEHYYIHPGVAITVSSGDNGYSVEFPAASQYVTAVGGTSLTMSGGAYSSETAWKGAGSGCSAYFAKPSWQSSINCGGRMVADVSAVADPNTGVRVYGPTSSTTSGWMIFGGTSASAPIIAGVYGITGGPWNGAQSIYLFGDPLTNPHDVTSGTNGRCRNVPAFYCTGVSGYDGPTGRGTPKGTGAF